MLLLFSILFVMQQADVFAFDRVVLRALYPNPEGSDTAEWIVVSNESSATISAQKVSIEDTVGATQVYTLPGALPVGAVQLIMASESGVSLNNSEDSVVLSLAGEELERSERYENAPEKQVWWQADDGVWRWSEVTAFLERLTMKNFVWQVVEHTSQAQEGEVAATSGVTGNLLPRQQPLVPRVSESPTHTESLVASPTPTFMHEPMQLSPTNRSSLSTETRRIADIPFPDYDFQGEKDRFVRWKQQALLGSGSLIFGGASWFVWSAPYWWERYLWRV